MELHTTTYSTYDLFALRGEMKINAIPAVTPQLYKHIQSNPDKNVVLDLSATTLIDSSAIRLLINLKKRVEALSRTLYLLKPSGQVAEFLRESKLDTQFVIIENLDGPSSQPAIETVTQYAAYTQEDGHGLRRLNCVCAVCGSGRVVGYLISPGDFGWIWVGDDPFPTSSTMRDHHPIDAFGLLPIVCLDCFMCSVQPRHFHAGRDGTVAIHSTLDEHSKLLLSKGIKLRKKLAETEEIEFEEDALRNPRAPRTCYHAYCFAAGCAHSMAVDRISASPFTIGWLSYLTIKYSPDEKKGELIDSCRTWMTQVVGERSLYSQTELAQAFFVLLNACMHLDKMKEASSAHAELGELAKTVPETDSPSIENPRFWHTQAQVIWRREIESKSEEMKIP